MPRERRAGKARLADTALNPAGWQRAPGRPPFLHCIIEQAGGQAGGAGGHVENATDFLFNLSCVAGHFSQEFRSGNGWKVPALLGEARALRGKAAAASAFFLCCFCRSICCRVPDPQNPSGHTPPIFLLLSGKSASGTRVADILRRGGLLSWRRWGYRPHAPALRPAKRFSPHGCCLLHTSFSARAFFLRPARPVL